MKTLITLFIACIAPILFAQKNVGIGVSFPKEKLDIDGAIKIRSSDGNAAGTLRFFKGEFSGNINGNVHGWRSLTNIWVKSPFGHYYLSPVNENAFVSIGDSLFETDTKLTVYHDIVVGGGGIFGSILNSGNPVATGRLGYQYSDNFNIIGNVGVEGTVHHDNDPNVFSAGVVGNNFESDTINFGGHFISHGLGEQNIGVYGNAQNGAQNWAGYMDGKTFMADALAIGTHEPHPYSKLHIHFPISGNFPHIRLEMPSSQHGFGLMLQDSVHEVYVGQNVGNWNDGRFTIAPTGTSNWFSIMQNGDIALTKGSFLTTPFARFQVPQKGSLNNGGNLQLENAAVYIGEDDNYGMAFDENQIESVGHDLYLNLNSNKDVRLAEGGGKVSVATNTPIAKFHVGEGHTVLFGNDTVGKSNFWPDAKLIFKPGKGGAFRVGQLNADGSIIGGTGWDYWDHNKIGWASVAIGNNTIASGAGSVALGIRCNANNFGAVALGHLSRTKGNSGVSAGYYTRADAFVSTAVGSGNVGGGSANTWNALDPIFEVGNSIDTTNRSNALTVLKNARVGINHHNPQAMLDIEQPNSGPGNGVLLNLAEVGHWETGVDNAADYVFYFNNIVKGYIRDNDGAYIANSDRRLKNSLRELGPVLSKVKTLKPSSYFYNDANSDHRSLGFIAQEVQPLFPELVSEKNGYLGICYQEFNVIAIKAIQELAEENKQMRSEIEELKNAIAELRKK